MSETRNFFVGGHYAVARTSDSSLTENMEEIRHTLNKVFAGLKIFGSIRRREVRESWFKAAATESAITQMLEEKQANSDALQAFSSALVALRMLLTQLRPILTPELDNVVAVCKDETHLLGKELRASAAYFGFSKNEVAWLFDELAQVGYRPIQHLGANTFESCIALIDASAVGELGVANCGFPHTTGDYAADSRVAEVVGCLRAKGLTPNVYLVLLVAVSAFVQVNA